MPIYEYEGPCGCRYEDFHSVADCDKPNLCPTCGEPSRRVISPVPTVGPMPSKPVKIGGTDQEFTDAASLRRYQAENPDVRMVSRDSSWWKNHLDNAREGAERTAQGLGWRDLDHKRAADSEAKKSGLKHATAPINT